MLSQSQRWFGKAFERHLLNRHTASRNKAKTVSYQGDISVQATAGELAGAIKAKQKVTGGWRVIFRGAELFHWFFAFEGHLGASRHSSCPKDGPKDPPRGW